MPRSPRRSSSPEQEQSRRGRSDDVRDRRRDRDDVDRRKTRDYHRDRRRDRDDDLDRKRDRDDYRDRRRDRDDVDHTRDRHSHRERRRDSEEEDSSLRKARDDSGHSNHDQEEKVSTSSLSNVEPKLEDPQAKQYGLVPSKQEEDQSKAVAVKQAPNFNLSGKLAEEQLTVNGVVLKFSQPPEARMPDKLWRLYVFKEDQHLDTLHIHRQPSFLFGRDRGIVDIPIDHPSCSKQHAALVYRPKASTGSGSATREIRPYLIDLDTTNGTFLNNTQMEKSRYYELKEKDVIKFGNSTREYVVLHNQSA